MKVAISGKGGVGKTILASLLAKTFAEAGYSVLAIDADPNSNLAATLGFPHPEEITPISEMSALIPRLMICQKSTGGNIMASS
jgi:CO dehydrogenase maturation factor